MCRLRNIAMPDYQESVTTGQTPDKVPLCFAGDTKNYLHVILTDTLSYIIFISNHLNSKMTARNRKYNFFPEYN